MKIIPVVTWKNLEDPDGLKLTLKSLKDKVDNIYLYTTSDYKTVHDISCDSLKDGDTDISIFTVKNRSTTIGKMKNSAVRTIYEDFESEANKTYVIFLESGDELLGVSSVYDSSGDPIYSGIVEGLYYDRDINNVLEYTLPRNTLGLCFNVSWLVDNNLEFDEKSDTAIGFIVNLCRLIKNNNIRIWSIDLSIASGRHSNLEDEIEDLLQVIDEDSADIKERYLLTRLILEGLIDSDNPENYLKYAAYAYPEEKIRRCN